MASPIWAFAFLFVAITSVLVFLTTTYLRYRRSIARIRAGMPAADDDLTGPRRALGWGLGLAFAGTVLFLASFTTGLPGEQTAEGQGVGLLVVSLGLAFIAYAYLAPRLQS